MGEPFGNMTTEIAWTFGISGSTFGWILALLTAQAMGFGVYMATRNMVLSLIVTGVVLLFASFMGFIPIWVCFIFFTLGGLMLLLNSGILWGAGEEREHHIAIDRCPICNEAVHSAEEAHKHAEREHKPLVKDLDGLSWRELGKVREGKTTVLKLRIEKASQKWDEYHNNLDALLGIKTENDYYPRSDSANRVTDLELKGKYLQIGKGYDWYIVDKLPDQNVFKVVGLHKKDTAKNCVYLLGKKAGEAKPFLAKLPNEDIEKSCQECVEEAEKRDNGAIVMGLMATAIGSTLLPTLLKGIEDGADTTGRR